MHYSVIIPVYNEEKVLLETHKGITKVMQSCGESYELIFIDDGSTDNTARLLEQLVDEDDHLRVLELSRNFGHQVAITAGMDYAVGDAVIVIDADLQDPPEVILEMIEKWREGYEVVYGRRIKRRGESFFKRATAAFFYRFLRLLTDVAIPVDVGDFRLLDRKVCDVLKAIREKNRFVRGLVSWVGFRQIAVSYVRERRLVGKTKYPLRKMIRFAVDGMTSFSNKPLKLASLLGVLLAFAGFVYLVYVLYLRIFTEKTIEGWTSIVSLTLIFNGVILIILGIMGEYIGRIYEELKDRPLYIIRKRMGFSQSEPYEGDRQNKVE